ncbi:kinesin-like protein KIF26B [Sinocyclocheilus rhinocerous]|uniref:kinesin-like protein KIF26B n=1 Tax=Sinocyclocheilus rhinocerous TaxID=307959 RepID=UPI0007B796C9|nr:PREDICTED: kinesin-like protein KIF26B [Sinocyclocheilus rhinocerous]
MTSLTGNKERSGTRSRKYGMTDSSPTKSASFSPETWYRKAYEESRSASRPVPEGAGSMPGSSGTPSPGSGISSPGSFSGSPVTISPGISTGSPGSLGGSPGFGTGSPASGSGSSPGSDRGIWCENCNARLVELKRQALKLLIPGPYSSKDPSFSLLLHDKLQVPNSTRKAWNERDGRCDVCATHLSQLKQEAVHMVLSLEQCDVSPGSPPSLASLVGSRSILQGPTPPRDWAFLPTGNHSSASSTSATVSATTSSSTPTTTNASNGGSSHHPAFPKHGSKPNSLGVSNGVEKKSNSPGHAGKSTGPQQPHLPSCPSNSNGAVLSSVALQAHQYLDGTWTSGHVSRANDVTLYPYQISQMVSEGNREGLNEAALNRYNTDRPSAYSSPAAPPPAPVTTAPSSGTSAAASFFARKVLKGTKKDSSKTSRSVEYNLDISTVM